ncbi:conserved hypothetical protein [Syntrophobacter sp. SbD1]|nr:conserved hypothetical protein [Syntrophobacter sp. SbD1]
MLGGIYSSERCELCGVRMEDNGKDAVCCPNPKHKKQRATNVFVKFPGVFKRFKDYEKAFQFLHGVRFKTTEGTFDERDYKKSNPLGFDNLAEKYLEIKKETVKAGSFTHIKRDIEKASVYFGSANIKEIGYGEIEDFILLQKGIASKTRHNIKANIHAFFTWLVKRRVLPKDQMPDFPEVKFELSWRKTITTEVQDSILEEIKRICWNKNPRIYIAIKWAATYIMLRPGELRGILEEDIDLERGVVFVKKHKTDRQTSKIKCFPLNRDDLELVKSLSRGFPKMPFFRRDRGGGGKSAGTPFGKHILYDYWKQACKNVGIEGIDLYGGTRHSSATDLRRKGLTPEAIQNLTGHDTSQAFRRYYQVDLDELREGYELVRQAKTSAPILHLQNRKADP